MPNKTFIRRAGKDVAEEELCAACECTMDATDGCLTFSRRYLDNAGKVVGRLDCPFTESLPTVDVDVTALSQESFRLRRVAAARAAGDWTERTEESDKAVIKARQNGRPVPV